MGTPRNPQPHRESTGRLGQKRTPLLLSFNVLAFQADAWSAEVAKTRVATREESGVLGFPSRRGLTPWGVGSVPPQDQAGLYSP